MVRYGRGDAIFTQGDPGQHVLYIWSGGVTVSAQSTVGKEAVVAVLGTGDFFGEGCLAGQPLRSGAPSPSSRAPSCGSSGARWLACYTISTASPTTSSPTC